MRANVAQYLSAMKQAAAAPETVSASAERSFSRLGGQMQSAGRAATLGITAPLVAAGAASVGMAAKFESSFGMMQGLAGVPQAEIEGLKASVLELAGQTAVAPQALAEGLYFLRSSGLDAGEAMEALEMSAKASAAGMGETSVIADAVSSAMNAYAASGLSAAQATDILVATARAGKAEPAELASALGRVLPIASELGITFADVGGAIAALSLNGNDASTSATLLTNVMSKLLKPSQQAGKALEGVGLSTNSIRQSIADNGLLATLQMLQDKLGDAGFIKFMEDAQAVQGALSLVNDESGNVAAAFDNVADYAGATGAAFDAMASTDAMKMKQALVDVQVAMVQLGSILLPIVASIAGGIADLASWFADLPEPVQRVVVAVGALAAAGGPLLIMAGSLVKNWTAVSTAMGSSEGKFATASKALGAIGLVAGAAVLAWNILGEGNLNASAHIDTASDALARETAIAYDNAVAAAGAAGSIDSLAIAHMALSNAIAGAADEELSGSFARLNVAAEDTLDVLLALGPASGSVEGLATKIQFAGDAFGLSAVDAGMWIKLMDSGSLTNEQLAAAIGVTVGEVETFKDALYTVTQYAIENKSEVEALALTYLDGVSAMSGAGKAALLLAEDIAGSRFEAGNAVDVYLEYVKQLSLIDPAAASAALSMGGALSPAIQKTTGDMEVATTAVLSMTQAERIAQDEASAAAAAFDEWGSGVRLLVTEEKALAGALLEGSNSALSMTQAERMAEDGALAARVAFMEWGSGIRTLVTEAKGLASAGDGASVFAKQLEDVGIKGSDAAYGLDDLRGAVDQLFASFLSATDPADRMREAIRGVWDEAEKMATAMSGASEAGLTLGEAFELGTATGRSNQQQLESSRDAIYEHGAAMMENGSSAEEAAGSIASNTASLRTHLLSVYNDEAAVDALIATYFRTPGEIETELQLIGVAQANAQIASHKGRLNDIPSNRNTVFNVSSNGVGAVENALNNAARDRTSRITVFTTSVAGTSKLGSGWGGSGRATGGYQDRPEVALWGEDGAEAMFPLTRPSRIRELWNDPRISGPMLAALGGSLTPVDRQRGAVIQTGSSGDVHHHYISNLSNNGRDLTPADLVTAFSQLRRSA